MSQHYFKLLPNMFIKFRLSILYIIYLNVENQIYVMYKKHQQQLRAEMNNSTLILDFYFDTGI